MLQWFRKKELASSSPRSYFIFMNRDLLICFLLVFASHACPLVGRAQERVAPPPVEEIGTLDATTAVSSREARAVILREEAVQRFHTPSVATKTILPVREAEKILLPAVDTISSAEIRSFQRHNIGDVLGQTAGVSLIEAGQTGSQTSLFIRGMESNHTVVLLNGRRLPPGLAGIYQLEYLDVSTLESVQITKGAASSLYGSDALAGVIDLRSTDARYVE